MYDAIPQAFKYIYISDSPSKRDRHVNANICVYDVRSHDNDDDDAQKKTADDNYISIIFVSTDNVWGVFCVVD